MIEDGYGDFEIGNWEIGKWVRTHFSSKFFLKIHLSINHLKHFGNNIPAKPNGHNYTIL